jgi:hypothetical protein
MVSICLKIQKEIPPDPAIFSSGSKILILLYIESELNKTFQDFLAKQQDIM